VQTKEERKKEERDTWLPKLVADLPIVLLLLLSIRKVSYHTKNLDKLGTSHQCIHHNMNTLVKV
jgi:hypothetical protein